ncbi:MAG: sigma-54-dependent Fis family transcriptional regulator [Candidatus Brocadiaceae bacterium]|nr:sigma-54-dependent Fis family transcriptional regulator [Candidatus Brocadiaceae bacterium]
MQSPRDEAETTVVVVDDDEAARSSIGQMLRLRRYKVEAFAAAEVALAWPGLGAAACAVVDVKMPGMGGEEFLAEVLRRSGPPVILITGHGDVPMAVRCLKAGAYDFVEKPFEDAVLLACVGRAVEKTLLRHEGERLRRRLLDLAPEEEGRFGMVGRSPLMGRLFQQIEVAAGSDAQVLIVGETGVGKELVARAVHELSGRREGPFVPVNAGALPESMVESELFGHARGAFTGADRGRDGKLVAASGGTLLLDEIESLSERAQVGLLRVLEDGLVYPLGMDEPRRVNIRLLATSKVDLHEHVREGRIREDFHHRLVVLTIHVPPLRERAEDIPLLVAAFARAASEAHNCPLPTIPDSALQAMVGHQWPGNVRELKHAVERMVITACDGVAGPFMVSDLGEGRRLLSLPPGPGRLREALEQTERVVIESALREHDGEVSAVARALGISRRALYERMRQYGLRRQDYQE